MNTLPIEVLHQLLRYEPETGKLYWREDAPNNSYAGKEAFTAVSDGGRRVGMIKGVRFKAHRVCFAMANGRWPVGMVDHIDGDQGNNRETNLREATHAQNNANRASLAGSKSRYVGVAYDKKAKKWKGQVYKDNRNYNTRRRVCETAAAIDRDLLAQRLHGQFTRMNINA